jgi:hypothetical protein
MCGSVSAIGLQDAEREVWPFLRERLRAPGRLMGLMRGVLGDAEVAIVIGVTPEGVVTVLALVATTEVIANEIRLIAPEDDHHDLWRAMIGDDEVRVLVGEGADDHPRPVAILTTPWIEQHLLLYARTLWRRR